MTFLKPWNILFLVGLAIYVALRGHFASRTKNNETIDKRMDLQERILLPLVGITSLLLPVLYLFTPLLSFADYTLPDWIQACGFVTMVWALWLFWRSHTDLGLNWSITLQLRQGHDMIQHGVYKRIRHPMYAAILLFSIAQALMLENWLAGWSVVGACGLMYVLRTPREEQMMRDYFGREYEQYMAKTGRLIPRSFGVRGSKHDVI